MDGNGEHALVQRFERAVRAPRLMMLYPPISTGQPYAGEPDARALWAGSMEAGTLYVHVPFCPIRCSFCPFHATVTPPAEFAGYVDRVLEEAALYAPAVRHVGFSSVYLGGGTPSVLPPPLVERLLRGLGGLLRLEGADVTLEAHPSTVDPDRLRDLRGAGVTRLSLGVQSFDARVLEACGRGDTVERVLPAVEAALAVPFRDVNVDLMYGLPEQTFDSWTADLGRAAELGVPGLTLYATVYLPSFQSQCEMQRHHVPTAADRLAMYELAHEFLGSEGYPQPHYGAGAFLRGGLNAHRRNVSLGLPTLGLGTWAYSSSGAFGWHNHYPITEWAREVARGHLPIRHIVPVPEPERARKYVIEALLLAYLDLAHFRSHCGMELSDAFPAELRVLERLDLAQVRDGELRLTHRGGRHLREIRYLFASPAVVEVLEAGNGAGL